MCVDLDLALIVSSKEDLAESPGVPFSLDRDAVRAEHVVRERPISVGALESQLELESVHCLPESESLGHDHAVAGSRPEADLLALDRLAGDGILAGERQDNSSLVIAHNLPEHRVKQVFGGGDEVRLVAAWVLLWVPGPGAGVGTRDRVDAHGQGKRWPRDRVAANDLQRQMGVDASLELGIVARREDGLDPGPILLELHLHPVAAGRLIAGGAQDQLTGIHRGGTG